VNAEGVATPINGAEGAHLTGAGPAGKTLKRMAAASLREAAMSLNHSDESIEKVLK
jgi:hypothetical protein